MSSDEKKILDYITDECKSNRSKTASYYEMLCQVGVEPQVFYYGVAYLASMQIIQVDDEGNIKLVAKEPKNTYSLAMEMPLSRTPMFIGLDYDEAHMLAFALNEAINKSSLSSYNKVTVSFIVKYASSQQ